MPTAKVTKNVSAATGGGNVLCSTLISIKTKAWLYSFGRRNIPEEHYTGAEDGGNQLCSGLKNCCGRSLVRSGFTLQVLAALWAFLCNP